MQPNQLWDYVDKDSPGGCWVWLRATYDFGYGKAMIDGKCVSMHRLAWELTFGFIPDGLCVCHHCDNPPCCNPDHLFVGTKKDNSQDMKRKGRGRGHAPGTQDGENNHGSKLTWEDAAEIRLLVGAGVEQRAIAKKFGVSDSVVHGIKTGKSWRLKQEV